MKAAVIIDKEQAPIYADFKDPEIESGHHLVRVHASSISQITKARASASHYSSDNEVPFVPGFDGVGSLADGSRVYFLLPRNPFGAMAEYCSVPQQNCLLIPDTLSPGVASAIAIPGMSSWAALVEQAQMRAGDTVLVNGANGISGRLAIQIAKYLGAGKIIATARRASTFDDLYELGADQCLLLTDNTLEMEASFKPAFTEGVHVVLDYLWGPSALSLINVAAKYSPLKTTIQFVQIGSIGGATIPMPASALRSSGLRLMGSGLGSLSIEQMLNSVLQVITHAPSVGLNLKLESVPIAEVSHAWNTTSSEKRTVLII